MKPITRNLLLALAIILAGWFVWHLRRPPANLTSFRTDKVSRGDLLVSISATGTVEPEDVIDVGAQVAGQIVGFGKDAQGKVIDYGSNVNEGTVLARIDDSVYRAQTDQAQAQYEAALANLKRLQADLGQYQAKLQQTQADWNRAQKLGHSKALSQAAYDSYRSAFETAKSALAVAQAAITQGQAQANQAQANLKAAHRNLDYCTIKSPVNGVIIDRRVNIGQTVVASLNAPSLFLLANDLRKMQVWVAVNEADIGKIHQGIPVSFTVDAFPNQTFTGEVHKVRLNASMTQNVVTYTVEISTDNSSGRLLPYLTANVRFELDRRQGVLMAPNAALRWKPSPEEIDPAFGKHKEDQRPTGPQKGESPATANTNDSPKTGKIWLLGPNNLARPLKVAIGQTDGVMTEVSGKEVEEGKEIITGVEAQSQGKETASNPFTPKFRFGKKPDKP